LLLHSIQDELISSSQLLSQPEQGEGLASEKNRQQANNTYDEDTSL
jgi:hypothetical protein